MAVHVKLDHLALTRLLRSPTGAVGRDALKRGRRVRDRARLLVGKQTGRLAASIEVNFSVGLRGLVVHVGSSLKYARYHHDGTGVYGPHGRPIRPRRGKVMVFDGRLGGRVYARSVTGQRGTKYLERSLRAAV